MSQVVQSAWEIFRWPLLLGLASVVGLVSALVGDGFYDVVSWSCLGLTLLVVIAAWRR
jgi:hypothetical protein